VTREKKVDPFLSDNEPVLQLKGKGEEIHTTTKGKEGKTLKNEAGKKREDTSACGGLVDTTVPS